MIIPEEFTKAQFSQNEAVCFLVTPRNLLCMSWKRSFQSYMNLALPVLQLSKEYALEVFSVEEVDGSEEDTLYLPVFPHKLLKVLENG